MNSTANVHPRLKANAENQTAPAKEFLSNEALEQRDVKWSAQTETLEEKDARLKLEKAEALSRIRREEREAQYKLEEEKAEARSKRRNQLISLCFVLSLVLILFVMCTWIVFSKQYSPDVEKWATVTLAAILTGSVSTILGFAVGRATMK
jgi:cation transport ATPase